MKLTFVTQCLLAASALAGPLATRQNKNIDPTILQFALTLEHLENSFYHGALMNFTLQDLTNAGYTADYYNNLKHISFDEQSHVQLLTGALSAAGYPPVAACQYKFPYTDVKSFITLASVLEGVGVSAYLAGAPFISSKSYLTVAGSILVAEALHASMQRSAISEVPMANPYGTPLDSMSVYTLAAAFITSCPASNAALPFKPFPRLSYKPSPVCYCEEPDCAPSAQIKKRNSDSWGTWGRAGYADVMTRTSDTSTAVVTITATTTMTASGNTCIAPKAGAQIKLVAVSKIPARSYVTFVSGLDVVSVMGVINGTSITAAIPSIVAGQTYVFVSKTNQKGRLVDANILFGPAIVEVNPAPPAIDSSVH